MTGAVWLVVVVEDLISALVGLLDADTPEEIQAARDYAHRVLRMARGERP